MEEDPPTYIRPGVESTTYRYKSVNVKEEFLQKDQLPPLPNPDMPNGFPSLDAVPAEYLKAPQP
jgi:hypothetical protein